LIYFFQTHHIGAYNFGLSEVL